MTNHAEEARGAEARAVDHKRHGRYLEAGAEYTAAATAWGCFELEAERAKEPIIAMIARADRSKARWKAAHCSDLHTWSLIPD